MATMNAAGNYSRPFPTTAFGEVSVAQNTMRVLGQFPYNINSELFTAATTGSATVTTASGFAVMTSGAAINQSASLTSKRILEYQPGVGGSCRFTAVFDTPKVGNNQYGGLKSSTDGFGLGYTGTNFSVFRRYNSVDTVITQANFNVDNLDGTGPSGMIINPQKGNVFQIQYQWLGFGQINFMIEDPNTGALFIFHSIKYANQNILTSVLNPLLPFKAESTNTTNNTSVVLKVPSISVYSEGIVSGASFLTHGAINTKNSITTETNIITIRNNATYQSVLNLIMVNPLFISIGMEGATTATLRMYKNPTVGGSPSFTNYNANTSTVAVDTAGTTISGGILQVAASIANSQTVVMPLENYNLVLVPGDTFVISASASNTANVTVGITWQERFT